jgi:hypothetical protein
MNWRNRFAWLRTRCIGDFAMAILMVGPNQQFTTLSAAISASHDGDTIYVQHGTYTNDFSEINTALNIIGLGGMAQFVATESPPNGKAILTTNTNVTIDHLEFTGTKVAASNGAGIRYQGGNLTITNSYFHDNQMGLLAAGIQSGSISIDHSEFSHNVVSDGSDHIGHNLYIGGPLGSVRVTNSYFHDAMLGHELKSRALNSDIENNRIYDYNSTASYSIDLPNGGNAIIRNNIIQQGPNSDNPSIIAYSAEGRPYRNSQLDVSGNTIINDMTGAGIGIMNFSSTVTASIRFNHFYGLTPGRFAVGPNTQSGNDTLSNRPALDSGPVHR